MNIAPHDSKKASENLITETFKINTNHEQDIRPVLFLPKLKQGGHFNEYE